MHHKSIYLSRHLSIGISIYLSIGIIIFSISTPERRQRRSFAIIADKSLSPKRLNKRYNNIFLRVRRPENLGSCLIPSTKTNVYISLLKITLQQLLNCRFKYFHWTFFRRERSTTFICRSTKLSRYLNPRFNTENSAYSSSV